MGRDPERDALVDSGVEVLGVRCCLEPGDDGVVAEGGSLGHKFASGPTPDKSRTH